MSWGPSARALYAERRRAKLCVQCGKPATGGVLCADHAAKNEQLRVKRYRARRAAGVCVTCESPTQGTAQCDWCLDARSFNPDRQARAS